MSIPVLQRLCGKALKLGLVLAAIILAFASLAQADPQDPTRDRPLADPVQEARARAFMHEIRCVVCQSQAIDESDAEIAAQLRNAIREQMAAGKNEDEIRDYLVARYGDFVLLKPPFKPATLLLWVGPFALVAIGFGIVLLQRRQKTAAAPGDAGLAPPDLSESERARVNRLLGEGPDGSRGAS
jgi:cytochrome c-type biogenesis protein CcmH